jgi:Na+/H+ antiporter NhaD/arsenite permease-like protein
VRTSRVFGAATGVVGIVGPTAAHAADASLAIDGAALGLGWVLPFAGLLLSIALVAPLAPSIWHHHYGKIAALWALAFAVPFAMRFGWETMWHALVHVAVLDYVPFIVLLAALYTAAGSIRLRGTMSGRPIANTLFLAGGTLLASLVGTTGACMLLIEPLLRANAWRERTTHTWIFFIFLVGNVGGALSPLGDPPLYIGFLQGVDFFWPTVHLAGPTALVAVVLLAAYWLLDAAAFRKEEPPLPAMTNEGGVDGARNLAVLAAIAGTVLLTGLWESGIDLSIAGISVPLQSVVRTGLIAALGGLAFAWTAPTVRESNGFTWEPIVEVAKLFAAIFICIVPALAIIGAGRDGAAAPLLGLLNAQDQPQDGMYFWVTGILSSVLDNAPTYLLFFNLAGGDAGTLQTTLASTLAAISAGAVFMGALTYIGNAPNFMVRSIVIARGRRMPSFFGYMAWSCIGLLPLFLLVGWAFF